MPHEASLSTFLSNNLINAVEEIAQSGQRTLIETHETALREFYDTWRSGQTLRAYFGNPPDAKQRTIWMSEHTRDLIREVAKADGVSTAAVVREALRRYCERHDYDLSADYPLPPRSLSSNDKHWRPVWAKPTGVGVWTEHACNRTR